MFKVKFERMVDRWGDPIYTAVLKVPGRRDLELGHIVRSEWELPKRTRWEVYPGDTYKPGVYPSSYEDTLADAKDEILSNAHKLLAAALAVQNAGTVCGQKAKIA